MTKKLIGSLVLGFTLIFLPHRSFAFSVTGLVVDESDKPIPNARVVAQPIVNNSRLDSFIQTTTDANGKFLFETEKFPSGTEAVFVEAYSPGYALGGPKFLSSREGFATKITLKKAKSLTVQLLEQDGSPAKGVLVAPAESICPSIWGLLLRTNDDGKVTFDIAPARGNFRISVADSRYVHADILASWPQDNNQKFLVFPGSSIAGRLVGINGEPLAGVQVTASASPMVSPMGGWGEAVTDAEGKFRISRLDEGEFIVVVPSTSSYAYTPLRCKVRRGRTTLLGVLRANRPGAIEGLVVDDATNRPIGNLQVYCESNGKLLQTTRTNSEGRFKVYGVGFLTLRFAYAEPFVDPSNLINLRSEFCLIPGKVISHCYRLRKASESAVAAEARTDKLEALILTRRGKPVPDAIVRVFPYQSSPVYGNVEMQSVASGKTNGDGVSSIQLPSKFTYFAVVASKEGFFDAWSIATAKTSTPVVIRMYEKVPIRGQVLSHDGKGLPNVKVTVDRVRATFDDQTDPENGLDRGTLYLHALYGNTPQELTDKHGFFDLPSLPINQDVTFKVSDPNFGTLELTRCVSPSKESLVKLIMPRTVTIRGKLVGHVAGLKGIPLTVEARWDSQRKKTPLKPDGTFEIAGVPVMSDISAVLTVGADKKALPHAQVSEKTVFLSHPFKLLEITRNGKTECFGIKELQVREDFLRTGAIKLEVKPLIKVSGRIIIPDGQNTHAYCLEYQGRGGARGYATVEQDGTWEIYSEPGPLTIVVRRFDGGAWQKQFDDITQIAKEKVVIDLTKQGETTSLQNVIEYIRVVNPDGVAVPRPALIPSSKPSLDPNEPRLSSATCGLDGTIAVRGAIGTKLTLFSPYLSKQFQLKLSEDGKWTKVRFSSKQNELMSASDWATAMQAGFG